MLSKTVRVLLLAVHGSLVAVLGLVLLYVGAKMTNALTEIVGATIAIVLSSAALVLIGVLDVFAAFTEGLKHLRRLVFYLLAGVALALAGYFLLSYSRITLEWLVLLATLHALVLGVFALLFAWKARSRKSESRVMYLLGAASLVCAGSMLVLIESHHEQAATIALGVYVCFVGAKILFSAWLVHRSEWNSDRVALESSL